MLLLLWSNHKWLWKSKGEFSMWNMWLFTFCLAIKRKLMLRLMYDYCIRMNSIISILLTALFVVISSRHILNPTISVGTFLFKSSKTWFLILSYCFISKEKTLSENWSRKWLKCCDLEREKYSEFNFVALVVCLVLSLNRM